MTIPQSIGKSNLSVTSTPGTSWHGNSPMPNVISSTQCCGMWMWWIFDVYIYITCMYIYIHCTYQLSNLAPLGTTLYEVMLTLHVFFPLYSSGFPIDSRRCSNPHPFIIRTGSMFHIFSIYSSSYSFYWLLVGPPLWKIWGRQLGWWQQPNIKGKIKLMATKAPTSIGNESSWASKKTDATGPAVTVFLGMILQKKRPQSVVHKPSIAGVIFQSSCTVLYDC